MDHLQIVITKNHVYPKELCVFYAVMIAEFISAQNILVCIIAINAFMLIYYRNNLDFGAYDWKILVITFGVPLVAATVTVFLDVLGPSGAL